MTREKQVVSKDDVGVLNLSSELVTKATAAAQELARKDLEKKDGSLAGLLKEERDDTNTDKTP